MSKHLKQFVIAVFATAIVAGFFVPVGEFFTRPMMVAYLAGLALFAGVARVRIPGIGMHMSAVDPIVFCALAVVGPLAACAAGTAAVLGDAYRSRATTNPFRIAFNFGNVFLSIAAAGAAFAFAGGQAGAEIEKLLVPLSAAVTAYFVANSMLTSAVLTLAGKPGSLLANWKRSFLWAIPAYIGGMLLSIPLYAAVLAGAAWSAGLAVGACWFLVRFFEAHAVSRIEPRKAA